MPGNNNEPKTNEVSVPKALADSPKQKQSRLPVGEHKVFTVSMPVGLYEWVDRVAEQSGTHNRSMVIRTILDYVRSEVEAGQLRLTIEPVSVETVRVYNVTSLSVEKTIIMED